MTKNEFKKLKVGDTVKEFGFNGDYYIQKITSQIEKNPDHNYCFNTNIIETNNPIYINKTDNIYSFACYKYELINNKPKKLYKPWG